MATMTINETGVMAITMANGAAVPAAADYLSVTLGPRALFDLITYPDGGELWVARLDAAAVPPVGKDLADGETFAAHDGCTWTRHGGEVLVRTPRQAELAAAA